MEDDVSLYAEGPVKESTPTEPVAFKSPRVLVVSSLSSGRTLASMGLLAALAQTGQPIGDPIYPRNSYPEVAIEPRWDSTLTPRNQRRMQKKALKKPRR